MKKNIILILSFVLLMGASTASIESESIENQINKLIDSLKTEEKKEWMSSNSTEKLSWIKDEDVLIPLLFKAVEKETDSYIICKLVWCIGRHYILCGRGELTESLVIPKLLEMLKKPLSSEIRGQVVLSLGDIAEIVYNEKATSFLEELLENDENPNVRIFATYSLCDIRDKTSVPFLIKSLKNDSNASVREKIAEGLRSIQDDRVIKALIESNKNDKDEDVRRTAGFSLEILRNTIHSFSDELKIKYKIVYSGNLPNEFRMPYDFNSNIYSGKICSTQKENLIFKINSPETIIIYNLKKSSLEQICKYQPKYSNRTINLADIDKDNKNEILFFEGNMIEIVKYKDKKLITEVVKMNEYIDQVRFVDIDNDSYPELVSFSHKNIKEHNKVEKEEDESYKFNLNVWKYENGDFKLIWSKPTEYGNNGVVPSDKLGGIEKTKDNKIVVKIFRNYKVIGI